MILLLELLLGFIVILLLRQFRLIPVQQSTMLPLTEWKVVDLTHPLTPDIPIWSGDPQIEIQAWASYDQEGYFINRMTIGEHSGTHWATPNTLIAGATSAAQVPVAQLVVAAIVIDVRSQTETDPDYQLTIADIQEWETAQGLVSAGSMVLLWTGWQERWQDPVAFLNRDENGVLHWSGFSAAAVELLVAQRQIMGLGTDTHGVDAGNDEAYGASTRIYQSNGVVLECLGGLEQLPAIGATLVIGGLPIQGGSGSPARVLAFLPPAARVK